MLKCFGGCVVSVLVNGRAGLKVEDSSRAVLKQEAKTNPGTRALDSNINAWLSLASMKNYYVYWPQMSAALVISDAAAR